MVGDDEEVQATDNDTVKLGNEWASGFDNQRLGFDNVHVPCDALTLRLVHTLRWDDHLYQGVRALWSAEIPVRLEDTTRDDAVHVYVPSHKQAAE